MMISFPCDVVSVEEQELVVFGQPRPVEPSMASGLGIFVKIVKAIVAE